MRWAALGRDATWRTTGRETRPEWNYLVNEAGDLLRATDPAGRFTEYLYDGAGRVDLLQVGGVGVLATIAVGRLSGCSLPLHYPL